MPQQGKRLRKPCFGPLAVKVDIVVKNEPRGKVIEVAARRLGIVGRTHLRCLLLSKVRICLGVTCVASFRLF